MISTYSKIAQIMRLNCSQTAYPSTCLGLGLGISVLPFLILNSALKSYDSNPYYSRLYK